MGKKVKIIKTEMQALRNLTIQIVPEVYERLSKMSCKLSLTKRSLINTAIIKLMDDIEELGVEL